MAFGLTPSEWFALPYWERRYLSGWFATYQTRQMAVYNPPQNPNALDSMSPGPGFHPGPGGL